VGDFVAGEGFLLQSRTFAASVWQKNNRERTKRELNGSPRGSRHGKSLLRLNAFTGAKGMRTLPAPQNGDEIVADPIAGPLLRQYF
jgi:hypothetical protein